jgi:hypothetical protein
MHRMRGQQLRVQTGNSGLFPLPGNPFRHNHFRLKLGAVIVQLPGR